MKSLYIVYHNNCMDGFFAAAVVMLWAMEKYGNDVDFEDLKRDEDKGAAEPQDAAPVRIVLVGASYGEPAPEFEDGAEVFVVDFSYPRKVLDAVARRCELTVVDHHASNRDALADAPYAVFDTDFCGAVLTWKVLMTNRPMPEILNFVQDRDLWRWELDESKEISAALSVRVSHPAEAVVYLRQKPEEWSHTRQAMTRQGNFLLAYQAMCRRRNVERVRFQAFAGFDRIPVVNTAHLVSETVGALAEEVPFAVGYFDTATHRVFNLRSDANGMDVSKIAKRLGGGGHPHAAGFTVSLDSVTIL